MLLQRQQTRLRNLQGLALDHRDYMLPATGPHFLQAFSMVPCAVKCACRYCAASVHAFGTGQHVRELLPLCNTIADKLADNLII